MPITISPTPPNLPQPNRIKKNLRLKIILLTFGVILISTTLGSLFSFHTINLSIYPLQLVSAVLISAIIWLLLKPIQDLYESAQVFARGEFRHRINIKTGDELQDIAEEFNKMADNLNMMIKSLSTDKEILSFERHKLNIILSSIPEGIIVLNLHKEVIIANQAALNLSGYTYQEVLSKPAEQLFKFTTRDGVQLQAKDIYPIFMADSQAVNPFRSDDAVTLIGKPGKSSHIKLSSTPIDSSLNADLGCLIILEDMKREKELEAIQLDFVSMASHELRTPLTSVIGYLSIFLDENAQTLNATQKTFLDRILVSAKQLGSLIDNLLNVSKVERGALNMSKSTLDWTKILNQVVHDAQIQAVQKNINLQLTLPKDPLPSIIGDSVRVNEVLNNLVSNAINYTPNGGSVKVSAELKGNEILTQVTDTGVGIPKEAQASLFTKFFRVSGALDQASNSKGTGLGLYISKSIIDLHHGKIWVDSTPGKGSTFSFTLPIANASPLPNLKPQGFAYS